MEYSYYGDSTAHVNSISERLRANRPGAIYNVYPGPPSLPPDYDTRREGVGYRETTLYRETRDGRDSQSRGRDGGDSQGRDGGESQGRGRDLDRAHRDTHGERAYTVDRASSRHESALRATSQREAYDAVASTSGGERGWEGRPVILSYPQYYQGGYASPYGNSGVVFPHSRSEIHPELDTKRSTVKDTHKEESEDIRRTAVRDTHVWRDMQSDWSLRIPRPTYES